MSPIFPQPIASSDILNSSPYLMTLTDFCQRYGEGTRRRQLICNFRALLLEMGQAGLPAYAALLGGSVLRLAVTEPKDLDGVIFYRGAVSGHTLHELAARRAAAFKKGLDLRLVPGEEDPVLALRAASFFTSLYTATKGPHVPAQGVVLVNRMEQGF